VLLVLCCILPKRISLALQRSPALWKNYSKKVAAGHFWGFSLLHGLVFSKVILMACNLSSLQSWTIPKSLGIHCFVTSWERTLNVFLHLVIRLAKRAVMERVWDCKILRKRSLEGKHLFTSGYPWPSDTMKSLGFFKPRETHTKAQSSVDYLGCYVG
jgi:hypothetical protein